MNTKDELKNIIDTLPEADLPKAAKAVKKVAEPPKPRGRPRKYADDKERNRVAYERNKANNYYNNRYHANREAMNEKRKEAYRRKKAIANDPHLDWLHNGGGRAPPVLAE